jgi:HK97 family phage major capsid protein
VPLLFCARVCRQVTNSRGQQIMQFASALLSGDWAALNAEADRLGIHVVAKALSLKALQEAYDTLFDEAEALRIQGETEDGLDDNQQMRWNEIFGDKPEDEEKSELAVAGRKLQAAKKLEGDKKKLAAMRLASSGNSSPFNRGGSLDDGGQNRAPAAHVINRGNRLQCFTGENGADEAYACGMWMRATLARCRNRVDRDAETYIANLGWGPEASTSGSPTDEGYLVPDPMLTAFIERRQLVGVMRQLARYQPLPSGSAEVPKLTSGPSVIYPGEATAPASIASQVWGKIRLEAAKRMVLGKFSRELKADAMINVVDQFVNRCAYEFAKQEDNEAINADGTSTYGREVGILSALGAAGISSAATGHDLWTELDITDFTSCMGILPSDYWTSPAWVCSAAFYHIAMLRVQASASGNTISTIETGGGPRPSFLGYPVYFTDRMRQTTAAATTCCLFGQFDDAIMLGETQGLEVAMSDDAYFAEDVTGVKSTTRIDWNAHECGDASNAGAVVALKTAA